MIDDDPDFRALVALRLKKGLPGTTVVEHDPACDGRPGPEFDWEKYDCVLLDYELGGGETGLNWLEQHRHRPGFPSVILLTSADDAYVAARAIKLGAEHFLKKEDADTVRLANLVRASVNVRRSERTHRQANESGATTATTQEIPGYKIIDLIGRGATSRVYIAERLTDGYRLVLKVMEMMPRGDAIAIKRFRREYELVAAVESPYVVRLHEFGVTEHAA